MAFSTKTERSKGVEQKQKPIHVTDIGRAQRELQSLQLVVTNPSAGSVPLIKNASITSVVWPPKK